MSSAMSKRRTLALLVSIALVAAFSSFVPAVSSAPTTTTAATAATTTSSVASSTDYILPTQPTSTPTSSAGGSSSSTASGNSTAGLSCPPPLLPNTDNLVSSSCMGTCCLPCPASSVFYEPDKLSNIYTLTSVFRAISVVACLILATAYLVLPSRRRHPHLIVLVFTITTAPWEGLGTAWLFKKEDLLCKSAYEIATISNSWLCGVQGTLLMYLVLVLLCLSFFLITNLHVLTVYRSTLIQNHLTSLIVLSFFLPLSLVLPVVIRKQIENPGFGSICFVSYSVASPYFFYPLSIIVCLAMVLHIGTVFFMIRTSLKANNASSVSDSTSYNHNDSQGGAKTMSKKQLRLQKARDISLLLKQQWRPGLFAFCLLVIDMIYWLFYFIETKKLADISPTTPWFQDWTTCLGQQAMASLETGILTMTPTSAQFKVAGDVAQRACAPIAAPFVPSFSWAALSDIAPAIFGVVILIIFGTKLELWEDLRTRIMGGKEEGVFLMGDITKNSKDQQQHIRQEQLHKLPQYHHDDKHDEGFYSEDINVADNVYSSRAILTQVPETASRVGTNARYGGRSAMSPHPTSPTSPGSPRSPGAAQRRVSITIRDNREPVYYHSPSQESASVYQGQQDLQYHQETQQQRARIVTEGSEPWPAWLSSSPTQSSSHQPPLTVLTNYRDGANSRGSPVIGSAGSRVISPVANGFYNADDLVTTQSYHLGQQQQQRVMQQGSPVLTSPGFSSQPPMLPQKSRRRG